MRARFLWPLIGLLACAAGCSLGSRSLERSRLPYNEAVKTTTEEQLLLNIVRLRYTDNPSSLSISSITDQHEIVAGLKAIPFFASSGGGEIFRGTALPQAEIGATNRPTLSYTPLDDSDFTRRLFTPITLDGVGYLVKSTWPVSTVFRLWLENLNWVSNAETASGPTPRDHPEYAEFLAGIEALQRLQDRKLVAMRAEEQDEKESDPVPPGPATATAAVEAVKAGLEYRHTDAGWSVVRKKTKTILRVSKEAVGDPDFVAFYKAFKLDPAKRTFELTMDKLDPFLEGTPEKGLDVLDVEPRSLLQVLFFLSHSVEVPPCHLGAGAPDTPGFDWNIVTQGLFKVHSSAAKERPACAKTAIRYRGHWFYIDDRDRDTKATFALLIELSRLELGVKTGSGPMLTLPLGGR